MPVSEERILFWSEIIEENEIQEGLDQTFLNDLEASISDNDAVLFALLIDSLPLLNCPVIAVDTLLSLMNDPSTMSLYSLKGLLLLYMEYNIDIDMIQLLYNMIDSRITNDNIDLLLLLTEDILNINNISISSINMCIKRLLYVYVKSDVSVLYRVLNVVSMIYNRYKLNTVKKGGKDYNINVKLTDRGVDLYLYELDLLKDNPILNVYVREIKQNKIVKISEKEVEDRVLLLMRE
ncbi:hypothetical protein NEAUS06_1828 [Nematocida ausubeli]|nr:hypothetical protein NEAUS06_1828 [Nematocida ausubeli]